MQNFLTQDWRFLRAHTDSDSGRRDYLGEHLNNVAEVAARFAAVFGADNLARILGLLHDAGKAWPEFQDYLERMLETPDWSYGASWDYMRELTTYWTTRYDWRQTERRLNSYPQFMARIEEFDIHFIYATDLAARHYLHRRKTSTGKVTLGKYEAKGVPTRRSSSDWRVERSNSDVQISSARVNAEDAAKPPMSGEQPKTPPRFPEGRGRQAQKIAETEVHICSMA